MKKVSRIKSAINISVFVGFVVNALFTSFAISAKEVPLDSVAVIVNKDVILESEIQSLLNIVKSNALKENQSLPSEQALRTQITDKLITDSLITQMGALMGIQISDAQLDETIRNMASENNMNLAQFRQAIIADGSDYNEYRESIRNEMISGEVKRARVGRRIYISPHDIENLIELMKTQTNNSVEYKLGHILIAFPPEPNQEEINAAKTRADKVLEVLNNGADFSKTALASSGDSTALQGGDLGWQGINEMPTLFSELVDGQEKGSVFGPIRTGLGFSIVKVIDIRGRQVVEVEEVESRHILLTPSVILSEEKAEKTLQGFLDQIKAGEATFTELAKKHSDGPSSSNGGELGWSDPNNYDPAFKETLATLSIDEYSKPFRSSFGWHIVQLTGRRTQDATNKMNERKAYNILYNRKFGAESARWIKEIRDEAFVEILNQGKK